MAVQCRNCKIGFMPLRIGSRYCSPNCRLSAWRAARRK
jgi:hypothetical protein